MTPGERFGMVVGTALLALSTILALFAVTGQATSMVTAACIITTNFALAIFVGSLYRKREVLVGGHRIIVKDE